MGIGLDLKAMVKELPSADGIAKFKT